MGAAENSDRSFQTATMMKAGITSPLHLKAGGIRAERVNWQSYKQGQMISLEEYGVITRLDFFSSSPDQRAQYLINNGDLAAKTFYRLIQHIAKDSTLQYLLIMIDDLLLEDYRRADMFVKYARAVKESPWDGFFTLLNRKDPFIINQASAIITKLACCSSEGMDSRHQEQFLPWLRDQLRMPNNEYLQNVCRCLQVLLRYDSYRVVFFNIEGISVLVSVLSSKIGFQLHYQLTFCLWCLTFNEQICAKLDGYGVIRVLSDILSETVKEKVTRIILATYRNMLEKPEEKSVQQQHALSMVQNKILKQLDIYSDKKYDDEDLTDDMKYIGETLAASVADLSSFDEYVSEVRSGRLEWSPVHKEIRFWRENAGRLNEANYELLKALIHLLDTSRDSLILSVAAHDVGEYVRHYPRGKHVLEQLGGKVAVMRHLSHEDPNVRYEALLSVQKLMVHNWEYLGKQLPDNTA